jgi:hypothetical protein
MNPTYCIDGTVYDDTGVCRSPVHFQYGIRMPTREFRVECPDRGETLTKQPSCRVLPKSQQKVADPAAPVVGN